MICYIFGHCPVSVAALTPPLLFHAALTLLLPPLGFFHLLVLAALMKVFHHHANKHVEDKKANDEEEGDEVQQHPWIVVGYRLSSEVWIWFYVKEGKKKHKRQKVHHLFIIIQSFIFPLFIVYIHIPADPHPQHPDRDTLYWPSRPWRPGQTGTSEPEKHVRKSCNIGF